MQITISPETFYLAVIVILMLLQVYQFTMIYMLKKEVGDLWTQLGILATMTSAKLTELVQKAIKDNKCQ
jgi:hypothetical protein